MNGRARCGSRFSMNARGPSRASALVTTRRVAASFACQRPVSSPPPAHRASCRVSRTAMGALRAIPLASSSDASSSSSGGTTRLTSPCAAAAWGVIGSPVSRASKASERGIRRGRRIAPPAMAIRPRLTSGKSNRARSDATIMSHDRANSKPPPIAAPSTAAIHGLARDALTKPPNPLAGCTRSLPPPRAISARSAPAQNMPGVAESSTAMEMAGSVSTWSTIHARARTTAPLMALRLSGRASLTLPTRPSTSNRTSRPTLSGFCGSSIIAAPGWLVELTAQSQHLARRISTHIAHPRRLMPHIAHSSLTISTHSSIA